jgi:hypothetical protein
MSRPARRSGPALLAAALLAALVALGVWLAPGASATCPSVWGCPDHGYATFRGETRTGEHVVVVGDSLVQNLGPLLADRLSDKGFVSFTIGAGGYAYWHWNAGVAQGLDIGDYAARAHADQVVLALGTNDARILAARPPVVTLDDVERQVRWGMARAAGTSTGCVILVAPTARSHPSEAREVRDLVARLATASRRFVVADWGAYSTGHGSWFVAPGNVHLSPGGNAAYATFLTGYAVRARAGSLGC